LGLEGLKAVKFLWKWKRFDKISQKQTWKHGVFQGLEAEAIKFGCSTSLVMSKNKS